MENVAIEKVVGSRVLDGLKIGPRLGRSGPIPVLVRQFITELSAQARLEPSQ